MQASEDIHTIWPAGGSSQQLVRVLGSGSGLESVAGSSVSTSKFEGGRLVSGHHVRLGLQDKLAVDELLDAVHCEGDLGKDRGGHMLSPLSYILHSRNLDL